MTVDAGGAECTVSEECRVLVGRQEEAPARGDAARIEARAREIEAQLERRGRIEHVPDERPERRGNVAG